MTLSPPTSLPHSFLQHQGFSGRLAACIAFWLALLTTGVSAADGSWDLNDVAYLFPLPQNGESSAPGLLRPQDAGREGELLPYEDFIKIPTLLNGGKGNPSLWATALRLVGARIDPCPTGVSDRCAPEIRLVWQPVEEDMGSGAWVARDAAVHSFYRLSQEGFQQLAADLWQLKMTNLDKGIDTDGKPLDIHPAFSQQIGAADFQIRLQEILLEYCGANNLSSLAFTSLLTPRQWWRFGKLQIDRPGHWVSVDIPRLEAPLEDIFNVAIDDIHNPRGEEADAVFNVLPEDYPEADNLLPLINKGYRSNDDKDYPIFRAKLDALARFDNPRQSNAETLDCAGCHYAEAARSYALRRFPALSEHRSADRYANPEPESFNLANTTSASQGTRVVRAFGFFERQPCISQRTIHDAAQSAHWLNTSAPPSSRSARSNGEAPPTSHPLGPSGDETPATPGYQPLKIGPAI